MHSLNFDFSENEYLILKSYCEQEECSESQAIAVAIKSLAQKLPRQPKQSSAKSVHRLNEEMASKLLSTLEPRRLQQMIELRSLSFSWVQIKKDLSFTCQPAVVKIMVHRVCGRDPSEDVRPGRPRKNQSGIDPYADAPVDEDTDWENFD